jgi:GNAT superfamily N-acetyltransferase
MAATSADRAGMLGERRRVSGDPAFAGLVAEAAGRPVGYLLYHPGYDIDRGGRVWHIIDLFVTLPERRAGIGRALMQEARAACRRSGGHALVWTVYPRNLTAIEFFKYLGAIFSDDRILTLMTE